ncbi:MAG TPA: hypothetical protein VGN98_09140 [Tianweitania sediminis]|jgi:hypothetical protein|nr:hypothetical protein [Tianweitania sediminis]
MPIRRNPHYFNDPNMANIASNLAGLFEPPSGAEAAGWANANATKADAARRQAVYNLALSPDYDQAMADRAAAAAGVYLPTQSWRAVEMDDAAKRYGFDTQAATGRYGHDRTFEASRLNNAEDNAAVTERLGIPDVNARYGHDRTFDASRLNNTDDNARALTEREMQEAGLMERQNASPILLNQGQRAYLPAQTAEATELMQILEGASKPLSETEWTAGQNQRLLDAGRLTDDDLIDTIMGAQTPVKAIDPRTNQPAFMTPGAATRTNAQPYEAASAERVDNYLAAGPNGEEIRFPGIVGPDGRIVNANTGQVVPNVLRKEGTGGGMSFEADGEGGVRFTTGGSGNTVSQQTNLQGQRDAATQSAQELQTLFDNLSAADVGVAGNFNDFLTNYGAQVFPDVARGDVTAMRSQMQATTMRLARSLSGDNRISDTDRRMAQEIMAGQGLGESLPGAKAKIAALTVLHAYRAKFAGSLAEGGDVLPPINGSVLGQLVDEETISPAIANEYQQTMLSRTRGGPTQVPGMDRLQPQQTAPSGTPAVRTYNPATGRLE